VPGLADVGHFHFWSLPSGQTMATLEIALAPGADPAVVGRKSRHAWRSRTISVTPLSRSIGAAMASNARHYHL